MWKIVDSPLSGYMGAHNSQESAGLIFVGVCLGIYSGFVKRCR